MRRRVAQGAVLLAILSWAIAPPRPIVVLGPQQHVITANPKIGVHTRLENEVDEWKIKRSLEMVREMGAPWIVEYFPWAFYEQEKGRFNWNHADTVVNHATRQGLTVIARLGFVPEWARPVTFVAEDGRTHNTTYAYLDEEHYADFGDYVYAFVKHFKGRVRYVVIWNEPNLSLEWGYRHVDPASYTRLLKVAYARAKEADPEVQVLGGALGPTLSPDGSPWGLDDLLYLQRMYDAGAADAFDILAAHAYGWKFPADDPPAEDKVNFRRLELLR